MIGQSADRPQHPLETVQRIEPARLENPPEIIADLIAELSATSAKLGSSLHPQTAAHLAELVRVMNTYYSNLIEGHDTRPRDIERALAGEFDDDRRRRNLQIEAAAHVLVQREIDRMGPREPYRNRRPLTFFNGCTVNFTGTLPKKCCWSPGRDAAVGRHIPPSSQRVEEFMQYFADRYRFDRMGKAGRIVALAAAHHRLNYVHPFPDGNGRVSRLMSHAMAWKAGIAAHGLWSVSPGLARGIGSRTEYKQMMDLADTPRQGDLDGRGDLSQRALIDFVVWFLKVAVDQVQFMSSLFDLENLRDRLRAYVTRRETLRPEASRLLDEIVIRGEVERGEASRITGLPERTARRVLSDLIQEGIVASTTPKGPVSLRFPADSLETLLPRLYPHV